MSSFPEKHDIVIVGGGICGLATALAFHRKGLKSLVLERGDTLRATGATIGIYSNGWRALDQLGVGEELRPKAVMIEIIRDVSLDDNHVREQRRGKEEHRCLRRSHLMAALAKDLPAGTIRFSSRVAAVKMDTDTSFPVIHLQDGSVIHAKVLIGCDGAHSTVAESLGLKSPLISPIIDIRGLTSYPQGHTFGGEFIRLKHKDCIFGRIPVANDLVYWFLSRPWLPSDSEIVRDQHLMKESAIKAAAAGFPPETLDMVKNSDPNSLNYSHVKYRPPWELIGASFRRGTMTVAGDAMHVMGPYLAQGGSAGLEDAIVLARCLAQEMSVENKDNEIWKAGVETAIDKYLKERKLRNLRLSSQTYLIGLMVTRKTLVMKLVLLALLILFFGGDASHADYDCGRL